MSKRIINNAELVERFGTDKNKATYAKYKKIGSMKKALLNTASCSHDIEDLGKGKYEIEERDVPLTKAWHKISGKKEQYLCYLILEHLLENAHSGILTALNVSLIECYQMLETLSDNYNTIKYNKKHYSETKELNVRNVGEFFKTVSKSLKTHMEKCLNILQDTRAIKWYKTRHVCVMEFSSSLDNVKKTTTHRYDHVHRRATKEEIQWELDVCNRVAVNLNITNYSSRYYSNRSKEFNSERDKVFSERNIRFFYDSYEVYYDDINTLEAILDTSLLMPEDYQEKFNRQLVSDMNKLAEKHVHAKNVLPTYYDDARVIISDSIKLGGEKYNSPEKVNNKITIKL